MNRDRESWAKKAQRAITFGSLSPKSRRLINEYVGRAAQMTEREKAILERQVWDALHPEDRKRFARSNFMKRMLGASSMRSGVRSAMLGYGPCAEILWALTEQAENPMIITTAGRLFRDAKKLAVAEGPPLADALETVLAEHSEGRVRLTPDGKAYKVRAPASCMPSLDEAKAAVDKKKRKIALPQEGDSHGMNGKARTSHNRDFWQRHRDMMGLYIAERLGGQDVANPMIVEQLYREFESELRGVVDGFTNRIRQRQQKVQESREVSERTLRKRVKEALSVFGLDLPRKNQPFDLVLLKKRYRKAAAMNHPDKHPGNEAAMQERFNHVTGAYEQVLLWYEQVYEAKNQEPEEAQHQQ